MKNLLSFLKTDTIKFTKFLFSGIPSFLLAIPLNYFLVEYVNLQKTIAYTIAIIMQVTVNYFVVKKYTFTDSLKTVETKFKFIKFFSGIILFRILDIWVYSIEVEYIGIYYLISQIINTGLFSVFKYLFSKKIFEGAIVN